MNDWIRQAISSSPICLSKIFVAPTMSAMALVLRISVRVCTFRIFLEQRAVILFLTFKDLHDSATAAEFKSVYETEALVLSPVKKWRKRFAEGRTSLYDDPWCGTYLTIDFTQAVSSLLKERARLSCKVFCQHFRIANGTCLRILHNTLGPIFAGFFMSWTRIRRPKESLYHMKFFRHYRAFILLVSRMSSLEMNHGSFCTIPVIRYRRHHEMTCQKGSVKN
jgi:hypothetical protein